MQINSLIKTFECSAVLGIVMIVVFDWNHFYMGSRISEKEKKIEAVLERRGFGELNFRFIDSHVLFD